METAVPSGRPSGQDALRPGSQSSSAWKAWKFAAREIFFGPRGIIKMSHLWLPLSFILLGDEADGLKAAFGASLAIIIAVLAKVQFSIQVNDLSDRKRDQEAGKKRWVGFLSKPAGVLVAALFLTAGLTVVLLRAGSLQTILAYSATVLLAVAYSSRPLRFKERGALGLLVYALSATIIYVVVPWTWLGAGFWLLIVLAAAVGADKWVQIHFHQVDDYQADLKTETRTYAVQAGLGRARSSLKWASLIASLCMLGLVASVIFLVGRALGRAVIVLILGAVVLAAVKITTAKFKDRPWAGSSTFTRELPWIYLGLSTFTFFVLPPVLFFFSARQEPRLWIFVVLSLFSLAGNSWQFLRLPNRGLSAKALLQTLRRAARLYIRNRSLRALMQILAFLWRKAAGQSPPIIVSLAVTYHCPCRCPPCYSAVEGRSIRRELTTGEFMAVLDQVKAMGALQVLFTGGEPLLRRDIFDLVAYAHRLGFLTRISTNGYLLTSECAAKLKRAGLNQCCISIDETDPAAHDRLRGRPGTFARAEKAFGYLRRCSIDRKMLVYATHQKIAAGLECFIELGRKLKVNSYHFNIPFITGRWADSFPEVLSKKEMADLRGYLKYSFLTVEFPTPETNCCAYEGSMLGINPAGEVTPCPCVPFSMGNVGREPLSAIWRRHVSALRPESRGRCPLNDRHDRKLLQEHCASVLAGSASRPSSDTE